jgi:hypothetical protein
MFLKIDKDLPAQRDRPFSEEPGFYKPARLWLYGNVRLLDATLDTVEGAMGPNIHTPAQLDSIEQEAEGLVPKVWFFWGVYWSAASITRPINGRLSYRFDGEHHASSLCRAVSDITLATIWIRSPFGPPDFGATRGIRKLISPYPGESRTGCQRSLTTTRQLIGLLPLLLPGSA